MEFVMNKSQKKNYLQTMCNKFGDFKISTHSKKNDECTWTKHKSILECSSNENDFWRMETANNRTLFDCEIVLDLDPEKDDTVETIKEKYEKIKKELLRKNYKFIAYFSGSRGYHFHLIFQNLTNEIRCEFRKYFIDLVNCDLMKFSDKSMISLEFTNHWKTGNPKRIVFCNDSKFLRYLKEEFRYNGQFN